MQQTADNSLNLDERTHNACRIATEYFQQHPDWTTFFREIFGMDGLIRKMFPVPNELAAFEKTREHAEILRMLAELRAEEKSGENARITSIPASVCRASADHLDLVWNIRLELSLLENSARRRFLVYPTTSLRHVTGRDETAAAYFLENWESGLLSGALYGLRKSGKSPEDFRLLVGRFEGVLRSEHMDVLANLAAQSLRALCGTLESVIAPPGWSFDIATHKDPMKDSLSGIPAPPAT